MTLLFILFTLVLIGVVVAVATGRITGGLDAPTSSLPGTGLPEGNLAPGDLDAVRFSPALRGYRMDEVDDVMDRLREELKRRDAELSRLLSGDAAAEPEPTDAQARPDFARPPAPPWQNGVDESAAPSPATNGEAYSGSSVWSFERDAAHEER
jgi:DivIVA domain-containing protein